MYSWHNLCCSINQITNLLLYGKVEYITIGALFFETMITLKKNIQKISSLTQNSHF